MQVSALQTARKFGLSPPTATKPETGPDRSERFDPSGPVGPEIPVQNPVHTTQPPANDALLGLVSGPAKDPSSELGAGFEPKYAVEQEGGGWQSKTLELESAAENIGPKYLEFDAKAATITAPAMDEADFIEFWAVDAWDALSGVFMMFRFDISEIETDDDELEQARKAAKNLYRLAKRRPKLLGWMLTESTLEGADWMMCIGFFGGKVAAVVAGIKERRKEKKANALATGSDPSGPVIEGEAKHV